MNDPYVDWDASYVLGALAPDDRRDYERHLTGCLSCSRSVAALAGLPGLLAAVPGDEALALAQPLPADVAGAGTPVSERPAHRPRPTRLIWPQLLKAAHAQRRRSRLLVAGALVVVAGVAASAALVLPGWWPATAPGSTSAAPGSTEAGPSAALTMTSVIESPLSAEIRLTDESWGTRIDTTCSYARSSQDLGEQPYALFVTDRAGASTQVATWVARPGSTVTPVATTSVAAGDIATIDIRWLPAGTVVLESWLGAN